MKLNYEYNRRYPKLVAAQKRNLAKQGKPTDYLELYEMVEEGNLEFNLKDVPTRYHT